MAGMVAGQKENNSIVQWVSFRLGDEIQVIRVPPSRPAVGSGQDKRSPKRQPGKEDQPHEQQRQRKKDDDASRIDEYV